MIFVVQPEQSAKTYPAFQLRCWPRWRFAHPDPHKGDGVERHFSARVPGCRLIVRPSSSHHTQTSEAAARAAINSTFTPRRGSPRRRAHGAAATTLCAPFWLPAQRQRRCCATASIARAARLQCVALDQSGHRGASALDQHLSQVLASALGYSQKLRLSAGCRLAGHKAKPCLASLRLRPTLMVVHGDFDQRSPSECVQAMTLPQSSTALWTS